MCPAEERRSLTLSGWGEIKREPIEVFSRITKEKIEEVKTISPNGSIEDDTATWMAETNEIKYYKTFHRMKVYIHEEVADTVGHLMLWDKEMRRSGDDDLGEDYLVAEMHVKEGILAELEQEIRQRGGNVRLAHITQMTL